MSAGRKGRHEWMIERQRRTTGHRHPTTRSIRGIQLWRRLSAPQTVREETEAWLSPPLTPSIVLSRLSEHLKRYPFDALRLKSLHLLRMKDRGIVPAKAAQPIGHCCARSRTGWHAISPTDTYAVSPEGLHMIEEVRSRISRVSEPFQRCLSRVRTALAMTVMRLGLIRALRKICQDFSLAPPSGRFRESERDGTQQRRSGAGS
jgi:hypothetical protein